MTLPEIVLSAVGVYVVPGLLVAVAFFMAAGRVDHRLDDSGTSVRLLLVPGVIAMWPIVVKAMFSRGDRTQ